MAKKTSPPKEIGDYEAKFEATKAVQSLGVKKLRELLVAEKARRGLQRNALVFIGVSNLASRWWCDQQSLFLCRDDELQFFRVYLIDRMSAASRLRGATIGTKPKAWLTMGLDIASSEILKEAMGKQHSPAFRPSVVSIGDTVFRNPLATPEERRDEKFQLDADRSSPWQPSLSDAFAVGEKLELFKESHRTVRWNWQWKDYVIVGMPDGVGQNFVYEYKTTRDYGMFRYTKGPSLVQADLYGYFLKKKSKKVQIYVKDRQEVRDISEPVDRQRVLKTLGKFSKADRSGKVMFTSVEWKCKTCKYRGGCPKFGRE